MGFACSPEFRDENLPKDQFIVVILQSLCLGEEDGFFNLVLPRIPFFPSDGRVPIHRRFEYFIAMFARGRHRNFLFQGFGQTRPYFGVVFVGDPHILQIPAMVLLQIVHHILNIHFFSKRRKQFSKKIALFFVSGAGIPGVHKLDVFDVEAIISTQVILKQKLMISQHLIQPHVCSKQVGIEFMDDHTVSHLSKKDIRRQRHEDSHLAVTRKGTEESDQGRGLEPNSENEESPKCAVYQYLLPESVVIAERGLCHRVRLGASLKMKVFLEDIDTTLC